jgi:L-arabinose transport system ATP-binding protein
MSKAFPTVQALHDVSLDIQAGEIVAVLGENGAGKSTLLRIINGEYRPDTGSLVLDGNELNFRSPLDAHRAGIRVIYQEPEIIPGVDVAENIYVGELPRRGPFVDRGALMDLVRRDLASYGFEDALPLSAMGDQLSAAQRQLVEILRTLKSGVRVLALDEPTSSLTDAEIDRLFALLHKLRSEGVAIIYVSHRIKEILRIADRVAIMRDGKLITVKGASELTEGEIVRLMVGRELSKALQRKKAKTGRVMLRVEAIESSWHHDVSFEICAGEVVGFAGLIGAGRTELAKVIFGDLPKKSGRVFIDGKEVDIHSPSTAVHLGIGFAPEDRRREGLALSRSVLENVSLAILRRLSRFHFVQRRVERRLVRGYVDSLRIRTPSLDQEAGKLSGGNQQKVVLARWLAARPKILILDEPTRGIDVGTKAEIYRLIDGLANDGLAIMLISSELPEIMAISDRIYVVQHGRIAGEVPGSEATEEKILSLAVAASLGAPEAQHHRTDSSESSR